MKREITIEKAIGRTIRGFSRSFMSGQMIICFDETFTTFGVERGYDPGDEWIASEKLRLFDFGDIRLVDAGILSRTEIEEMLEKKAAEERERREQDARRTYEKLKAKFGDSS